MTASDLEPNPEEALRFLLNIIPGKAATLVGIGDKKPTIAKTFDLADEGEALKQWVGQQNRKGYNLYWMVNELVETVRDRKARKRDVIAVRMLHVDLDDPSTIALERLKAFTPRPSVILFSGGGYQAFWLLDQPLRDIRKAEEINKDIARKTGGDNCHNADRIMRLPGTINWPNKKKQEAGRVPVMAHVL